MNPITHGLLSWLAACALPDSTRRERALITTAGLAPDLDGFGIFAEYLTRNSENQNLWWTQYHHELCHNLFTCCLLLIAAAPFIRRKASVLMLMAGTFHLHLLCDVVGARGPDGEQWPIPYLKPFSDAVRLTWEGQWALNAWQNIAITIAALIATLVITRTRGYSPVGIISPKLDDAIVATLRRRFPLRRTQE